MSDTVLSSKFDLDRVLERVDAYAHQLLSEDGTPGYALSITDRAGTLIFRGYGHIDLAKTSAPTEETLYESGSIGKSFTAVVLLQLAAEGKVDLHAPIADQLPLWQIPSEFEPITVHDLLTHTSGLTGGTDHVPAQEYELFLMRHSRIRLAKNRQFIYSNLGYKALGLLVEHVTGQTYAEVIQERIFEPLGLVNAEGAITSESRPRMAPGYSPHYDDRPHLPRHGWVPATWLETNTGDGCMILAAPDLVRYLRALLNKGKSDSGTRILTDDQFQTLTRPHTGETPQPDYGYGITYRDGKEAEVIGHSGGMVGYVSHMIGDLRSGYGVVAFNNAYGSPVQLADYALRCLVASAAGNDLPDLPKSAATTPIENPPEYVGSWRGSKDVDIVEIDGGLAMDRGGVRIPLIRSEADSFIVDHPDFELFPLTFTRDEAGEIIELTHGPDWFSRADDNGPQEFDVPGHWRGLVGHYRSYNPWTGSLRVFARKDALIVSLGRGHEAQLTPDGDAFLISTPRSVDEVITFGPFHNAKALVLRFDNGTEFFRFFTP